MDYEFTRAATCTTCGTGIDPRLVFPVPKLYDSKGIGSRTVCEECHTRYHQENPIVMTSIMHTKQVTGWNPQEKTFVEYCGKDNFHNNHEVLDSVPLDRAAKARIAKSKYDKGV